MGLGLYGQYLEFYGNMTQDDTLEKGKICISKSSNLSSISPNSLFWPFYG